MTRASFPSAVLALLIATPSFFSAPPAAPAQTPSPQATAIQLHHQGHVEVPASSVRRPEDAGKRAHTNILIWRDATPKTPGPLTGNAQPSSTWETPASIACVYNIVPQVSGCPITSTTTLPTGGFGAIAIVDAYDDPNAASDLAVFSSYFNLPAANFQVIYASGSQPAQDPSGDWEVEESLDIEWAHAMAPSATVYLVEAASNSYADLMTAEQVAGSYVSAAGGGVVSNSWGGGDFSGEASYDSNFTTSGVVYFASTGDCAFCIEYPSVSPNVVAVGGTSLSRDGSGNFTGESYWEDSWGGGGGGLSQYESIPSFQNTIASIVGSQRGVPDLSSDADPVSGVAIYDTIPYEGVTEGWMQIGGTSVASPTIAARVDAIGGVTSNASLENSIYGEYANGTAYPTNFRDITSGDTACVTGWDICSGIGSPLGNNWLPGASGAIVFSPTSASFSTPAGTTSANQTITVTNNTGINLTNFNLANSNSTNFVLSSSTCSSSFANGASCTFSLACDPSAIATATGTITGTGNGYTANLPMSCVGTNPGGSLTYSLSYGSGQTGPCGLIYSYFTWTYTVGGVAHTFPYPSIIVTKVGNNVACKGSLPPGTFDEWSNDGHYYLVATGSSGAITAYH